jgi:hypothetical protein
MPRYFEYYFKDKPTIIRKQKLNSCFRWNETTDQRALGEDILDILPRDVAMYQTLFPKAIVSPFFLKPFLLIKRLFIMKIC